MCGGGGIAKMDYLALCFGGVGVISLRFRVFCIKVKGTKLEYCLGFG